MQALNHGGRVMLLLVRYQLIISPNRPRVNQPRANKRSIEKMNRPIEVIDDMCNLCINFINNYEFENANEVMQAILSICKAYK